MRTKEGISHKHLNEFERTLEKKLSKLLSSRELYIADRIVHESVRSTNDVIVSLRVAGTSIGIWIYNDEAEIGSDGISCRFERYDYDTSEELMAAFLTRLEEFLPEAENVGPIKLPVLINESSEIDTPGDLQFFERLSDAEGHLEAIDVENKEYFGFDGEGRRLCFDVVSGRVRISAAETTPDHEEALRKLLVSALHRSACLDEAWSKSASLQQLLERGADVFPSSITSRRRRKASERKLPLLNRFLELLEKLRAKAVRKN